MDLLPVPDADGFRSTDELADLLRTLRAWAGNPSYAELVRRISALRAARGVPAAECAPGRVTVYDCFRTGRRRIDMDLVLDIVTALGAPAPELGRWRRALRGLLCRSDGWAGGPRTHAQAGACADAPVAGGSLTGRAAERRPEPVAAYRRLSASDQRLFRLLALHPGDVIDAGAAAALGGVPVSRAAASLRLLGRERLLLPVAGGRERYRLDSAERAFALRLTVAEDPHDVRHQALDRLVEHYGGTATAAAAGAPDDSPATPFWDGAFEARLAQLRLEGGDMVRAAAHARTALAIAIGTEDRSTQALALTTLGAAAAGTGDHASAERYYGEALSVAEALGDPHQLACVHQRFADALQAMGRPEHAALHQARAAGGGHCSGSFGMLAGVRPGA
ncbi:hypothetical protein [Streptomyces sp. L2]|uniref:hypothetical protein n=1 Tax=Streptomyces sp. L2 TaxID=2162665 RepID=UPI0019D713D5|nr:hypothetical protein [Streptomyces sp. L2]